jgi:transporter family-2 protein
VSEPSRALRIAAVPIMLLTGGLVSVQSQINGRLATELGTGLRAGIAAAIVSFGTGLVLVGLITAALPSGRAGFRALSASLRTGRLRWPEMLGGAFGGLLVATQGLTVGVIGVALFSIALTAGQSASALVVDHYGLGPSGHQPLSFPRLVAAAFAVISVLLAAGERLVESFDWRLAVFALLPLLGGAGASVQQALNGRLSAVGGPWATTLNNFVIGLAVLFACFAASLLADGSLAALPSSWWLYAGGAIGVSFIWLSAALVRVHGVLVLSLSMIAGNVIGAELIELIGGSAHIGFLGVLAGALTVVGVLVAVLVRPRPPASA